MSGEAFEFSVDEVTCDDASSATVDDDYVLHFIAAVEFHGACVHLAHKCGVGAEEELLSGLSFCVERTAHLHTTEGAVGEETAIFASEGNALCDTLVDDVGADFSETIDVGFASTIVTTFDGVVEETIDGVAVVLIVLCGVDTTLCGDGVSAAGRILDAEVEHVEAHFAERSSGRGAGKSRTNHDDVKFTLVGGVH